MFNDRQEIRLDSYIYLISPDTINTIEKLADWDKRAVRDIISLEEKIETLKQYRQLLFERTQILSAAQYKRVLKIVRNIHRDNSKSYTVSIVKDYGGNIGTVEETTEQYEGKKRHEALARFAKLKKENPGIEAVMDIAKRRWEK